MIVATSASAVAAACPSVVRGLPGDTAVGMTGRRWPMGVWYGNGSDGAEATAPSGDESASVRSGNGGNLGELRVNCSR